MRWDTREDGASQLAYKGGEPGSAGMTKWEFSSAEFWGEDPSGRWTLSVEDDWAVDEAIWNSFEFTGYAEIPEFAALAGDFDGDGDVDGVDFLYWQAGYPTASGASHGDADDDGDVDGVDFGIWQANYPTNLGGSAAIPEPTTLGLFVIGGLALLKRRK